jgi:phospholipase A-2-activating protein
MPTLCLSVRNIHDEVVSLTVIGHGNNVCALDVSQDGKYIISGAWDSNAMIWQVGKWEPGDAVVLQGHEAAVWGVLAFSDELIVTGKTISFMTLRNIGATDPAE